MEIKKIAEPTEAELINALIKGDRNAFKALFELYYDPLFRFLWRKTRDKSIAEDLIQTLFINVWNRRTHVDSSKSFKSYLYKSASNLAINHLKKMVLTQSTKETVLQTPAESTMDREAQLAEYLEDALYRFPYEQRSVFLLNKFEGFKYVEIAEMLGVSVKTVESRMSKVLKALRNEMAHLLTALLLFMNQ